MADLRQLLARLQLKRVKRKPWWSVLRYLPPLRIGPGGLDCIRADHDHRADGSIVVQEVAPIDNDLRLAAPRFIKEAVEGPPSKELDTCSLMLKRGKHIFIAHAGTCSTGAPSTTGVMTSASVALPSGPAVLCSTGAGSISGQSFRRARTSWEASR